jgi:hypothetical protein
VSGPLLLYRSLDRVGPGKLRGAGCAVQLHLRVERGGGESTRDLQIFRVAYRAGNTLFRHGAGWRNDDSVAGNRQDVVSAGPAGRRRAGAGDLSAVGDREAPWRGGAVAVARPVTRRKGLCVRYPAGPMGH